MVEVGEIDQHRPHERAGELAQQVHGDVGPGGDAADGEAEGHRRVDVGSRVDAGRVYARRHGETPPRGDDDPAGTLAFRLPQQHVGHDAITQQDEDGGADQLGHEYVLHASPPSSLLFGIAERRFGYLYHMRRRMARVGQSGPNLSAR